MSAWDNLRQDWTFGWRSLRRSPGFVATALVTLSLGIGAATGMFSVVQAVWLRPLPYLEPGRLVAIWSEQRQPPVPEASSAYGNIADWQRDSHKLRGVLAYDGTTATVLDPNGEAQRVGSALVGAEFFSVLGVMPALGRGFSADEAERREALAVVSHDAWRNRFGGDPHIVGRQFVFNGRPAEIIGVMPRGFYFPDKATEIWVPLSLKNDWDQARNYRGTDSWRVVARLAPGVTLDEARSELAGIAARLEQAYPAANAGLGVRLVPLPLQVTGRPVRLGLLFLSGAVLGVLLIACSNVASLLLVRGTARQREFAVREALGASRSRVVRQLLAESGLLALLAAGLGAGVAEAGLRAVRAFGPAGIPRLDEAVLDPAALAISILLSVACVVLFSLVPALAATRGSPLELLRSGRGQTSGAGTRRLRTAFVVAEFALAVTLLISSAVFLRSFARLTRVDTGFHAPHVLLLGINFPAKRPAAEETAYVRDVLARVTQLPGVTAAGLSEEVLLGEVRPRDFLVEGATGGTGGEAIRLPVRLDSITPDYFRAAGVALVAGRFFNDHDGPGALPVVIINESLAHRLWPGADPIGRRLRNGDENSGSDWLTVVGVVADLRRQALERAPVAQAFYPYEQRPAGGGLLAVSTSVDASTLATVVRAAVLAADHTVLVKGATTLQRELHSRLAGQEFNLGLLAFFAVTAVTLAGVGIFGLMSYAVTLRFPEFGIRLALGAEPRVVMRQVVLEGLRLALAGIVLGGLAAALILRGLAGLLYETSTLDPVSFGAASLLLVAVAWISCYLPARRVLALNPLSVLQAG
jgi:predicted permease